MIRELAKPLLIPRAATTDDPINLRLGFALYVAWMAGLCLVASASFEAFDGGSAAAGRVWLATVMVFYLSMCCTFCPLPTAWIVMLAASNDVSLIADQRLRLAVVAGFGALGTAVANLAEYYVWTFVFRLGWAGRVRETRFYLWAARWFAVAPFGLLATVSLIPVPVDVIRWLAALCRYPRGRFFAAYYVGRWARYAMLGAVTIWLDLGMWHIIVVQVVLVMLAASQAAARLVAKRSLRDGSGAGRMAAAEARPAEGG